MQDGAHRVFVMLNAALGRVHGRAEGTRAGQTVAGVRELDDNIDGCEALASALATTVATAIDPGDSRERQSRGYSRVKLDAPGLP